MEAFAIGKPTATQRLEERSAGVAVTAPCSSALRGRVRVPPRSRSCAAEQWQAAARANCRALAAMTARSSRRGANIPNGAVMASTIVGRRAAGRASTDCRFASRRAFAANETGWAVIDSLAGIAQIPAARRLGSASRNRRLEPRQAFRPASAIVASGTTRCVAPDDPGENHCNQLRMRNDRLRHEGAGDI